MSYAVLPGIVVDVKRRLGASEPTIERGVVILEGATWLVAYLPGKLNALADPAAADSIHVVDIRHDVEAYHDVADCDPVWVSRVGAHLATCGPGLFQSPAMRVWDMATHLAQTRLDLDAALGRRSPVGNHRSANALGNTAPVGDHVVHTGF